LAQGPEEKLGHFVFTVGFSMVESPLSLPVAGFEQIANQIPVSPQCCRFRTIDNAANRLCFSDNI
jgi:hypothetical protein